MTFLVKKDEGAGNPARNPDFMTGGLVTSLTGFQRRVIGVAAGLIALRLFAPIRYALGEDGGISYIPGIWFGLHEGYRIRIATGATLLNVLGLAILAAAICALWPDPRWARHPTAKRIALWSLALAGAAGLAALVFGGLWVLFPQ